MAPLTFDLLIPTRGRPDNILRVAKSARDSADDPKRVTLCFWLDIDDEASAAVEGELRKEMEGTIRETIFLRGPHVPLPMTYNEMAQWVHGDVMMYAADDIDFVTKGWDTAVEAEFQKVKDRALLVWCHDPARGDEVFPDHGFISRWSRMVLKYVFPMLPADPEGGRNVPIYFADIWLNDLYRLLDRRVYLPDITISHRHWYKTEPKQGERAALDDNYVRTAILTHWRMRPTDLRNRDVLEAHANLLREWMAWVEGGGLERVVPDDITP